MAKYPWPGTVLYWGQFVSAQQLPWHYALVWIGITVPLWTLCLFFLGVALYIEEFFLYLKGRFFSSVLDQFWMIILLGSLAMVILFKPVLYDGWRHLYYLYPALLWFALKGTYWALIRLKMIFLVFLFFALSFTAFDMFLLHPYEHVFFNFFVNKNVDRNFEMDYWGLSFFECLKYVIQDSSKPSISIAVSNDAGIYASYLLNSYDLNRVRFVSNPAQADYFIGNFRWHPKPYSTVSPCYSVYAKDYCLAVVYKI